jgi:hypothetical protein
MEGKAQERAPLDFSLAGESRRAYGSELLPQRLAIYAKAHERAVAMSEYIRNHANFNSFVQNRSNKGIVHRLGSCGNYLLFRDYYQINEVRLHQANFCKKHLVCPLCALRRGSKYVQAYSEKLNVVLEDDPGLWPYLVTLTVKDGPDLMERFNHLKFSVMKMTELRKEAGRDRRGLLEMNKALGGVSSYEVKKGKNSEEWHPHYHATWLCKEQPYETKLSEEWEEITGDSFIVDVKPFDSGQDIIKGFLEVFAYSLKLSTLTLEDNWEAFQKLQRTRFINSFGVFRGVQVPEALEDEPIENEPFIELLYRYVHGSGYNFMPGKS